MAQMVEVGDKPEVVRSALAEGVLHLHPATIKQIMIGTIKKGEPLVVAKVAAIQAVKETPRMLPLCHPIPITGVEVKIDVGEKSVHIQCRVSCSYKTGVEMEALAGVSVGLLTIWDMVKYLEKDADGQYPGTTIDSIRVVSKEKGR